LQQDIGGGGEQHAHLIRPEAGATGTADGEIVMQFLDPIFQIAPRAINRFVQPLRRLPQVGDDEAGIVTGRPPGVLHNFRFDDDAARLCPRLRLIDRLGIDVRGLAREGVLARASIMAGSAAVFRTLFLAIPTT
jgi:hypothetical protein